MQQSTEIQAAMRQFYERFSAGDVDGFARTIAAWDDAFVIGTGPAEWLDGRANWIAGYQEQIAAIPGIRMEAGDPRGYAQGDLGWAADRPTFVLPDGSTIPARMTAVLRREDDTWKLINVHFSIGMPDEMLFELLKQWSSEQQATSQA